MPGSIHNISLLCEYSNSMEYYLSERNISNADEQHITQHTKRFTAYGR